MQQVYSPMQIEQNSMIGNNNNVIKEIFIRRLIIRETGSYNNQFTRSYQAHLSPGSVDLITEKMAQTNAAQVRPSFLSGIAGGMISISAMPESRNPIDIANGWHERRLLFFMDVLTVDVFGSQNIYYVQGYTDHMGLSLQSKAFDPDMIMFINNMMVSRVMYSASPAAGSTLISADHVLFNSNNTPFNGTGSKWTMRPEDVYKALSSAPNIHVSNEHDAPLVLDQRIKLSSAPKMSKRSNAIPTNYASNVLNGFLNSTMEGADGAPLSDAYEGAVNYTADTVSSTNPFLAALSRKSMTNVVSGMFRWRDLLKIDPNIHNVTTVTASGVTQARSAHASGMTAEWSGATIETKYAASISQAVPALMMENMLYQVSFSANNTMGFQMGTNSGVLTVISNALNMNGEPAIREIENFKRRLEVEVLKDISFNNEQKFDIHVNASVFGDTWLSISVDGGPVYDFVTPTFCDGIISPVLTNDYSNVHNLAGSMEVLVTQVQDARMSYPQASNFSTPLSNSSNYSLL